MKKRLSAFFACFLLLLTICPVPAHADIGPKPSVRITFENLGDELCYGTLLSDTDSTGPSSVWDGTYPYQDSRHGEEGYPIWKAFVDYDDPDGFYFLQEWWDCSESKKLEWTYYPPQTFKILLYYPESNRFVVSGIYERYAFDSYYTVEIDGTAIDSVNPQEPSIVAEKSYDYTWELISLVCRIAATIGIELVIALLFGFRQKRLFSLIVYINVITQVLLNVALNIINYNMGSLAFVVFYLLLEIAVFVIEAILYGILFSKTSQMKISKVKSTMYALVANGCSFAAGFWLAKVIPGIF